jgi:hypothetical protein
VTPFVGRWASAGRLGDESSIAEAGEPPAADDHVVEYRDVEELARGRGLSGQMQIIRTWRRIATRMVMHEQDRSRLTPHGLREQLSHADQ